MVLVFCNVVAEAALPVQDPDEPDAFPVTLPVTLPVMFTVVIGLVDGLYFNDASVFTLLLPEAASTIVMNLSALVLLSSFTATCDAAPAESSPAFIHLVSVPSDDNTCPLLPKALSPSLN